MLSTAHMKKARPTGSVHADGPPEACGEAPPTSNRLLASTPACLSTNADELEPFPVCLSTFLRQVTRASTLKRPFYSGPCMRGRSSSVQCAQADLRTVTYCLCLPAAAFSPVPLVCSVLFTHGTQPSLFAPPLPDR